MHRGALVILKYCREGDENMKRTACIVLTAFMTLVSMFSAYAEGPYVINEREREQTLAEGVVYKNIFRFTEEGVSNINIVEADISNENVGFDVIFNEEHGFSKREKLSSMVTRRDDVLAAINGDFFSMSNPSFPLGTMVRDGKILSNPYYEEQKYASIIVDDSKNILFEYLSPNMKAVNTSKEVEVPVAAVNKPSEYFGNIVALTSEYVKNSPGANDTYYDVCEVVVDSGVVSEVRYGQPPLEIPESGYVLVAGGNNGAILRDNFALGESVELSAGMEMDHSKVEAAMGAGSVIIRDGQLAQLTQKVSGKSQRSAIGLTDDDKLIMFTVDGRLENYIGMEPEDVANYMLNLGCEDAVILDGGGSTELIANDRIRNTLVNGREREILNAFAVKTSAKPGRFDHMEAHMDKEIMYLGESAHIEICFFDRDDNPVEADDSDVEFDIDGIDGNFEGGMFTPSEPGSGTIEISYDGESEEFEIEVVEKKIEDDLNIEDIRHDQLEDGVTLAFFGDMGISNKRLVDNLIIQKYEKDINKIEDPSILMLGNTNQKMEEGFWDKVVGLGGVYGSREIDDDILAVSLDNSSGTFYKTPGQWAFLEDSLDSDYDNIVVVFNSKEQIGFDEEAKLFKSSIYENAKDKNIYVVYRGSSFSQTVEGNARYISIPDYDDLHKGDYKTDYRYLVMNIDGENVKYGYMNIFGEE